MHTFFFHVDEESLESVVDDMKSRERGGYFCTVVRANNVVFNRIESREKGVYFDNAQKLKEDEMWDLRRRVRVDDLVGLYAEFQVGPDLWYCLSSFGDDIFVP
ncbi:hypothetical protein N657DRAFT_639352 [Parathielavia appendiculata]|uniref:Uncharacterized protein n=1 Tax=Parathielavia appendiculata TaxID=2587402 RepID=A0AAN6Z943_9PEZI|nr:hypothetical protein N657DRAFT_639352 [Parathielavia appendiculata]